MLCKKCCLTKLSYNNGSLPVRAICLNTWTHVIGPHTKHVWLVNQDQNEVPLQAFSSNAKQTLGDQLEKFGNISEIYTKQHTMSSYRLMSSSLIFCADEHFQKSSLCSCSTEMIQKVQKEKTSKLCLYSLSILCDLEHRVKWFQKSPPILSFLRIVVAKLRILLLKKSFVRHLSKDLLQLFLLIDQLFNSSLPEKIHISDTFLLNPDQVNVKFLSEAVSSQFVTASHSLVIGSDEQTINKMVLTLACFLLHDYQRHQSCLLSANSCNKFLPNLHIQGIIMEDGDIMEEKIDLLYLSEKPTTLVDLRHQHVKRSSQIHKHYLHHKIFIKKLLQNIYDGSFNDTIYLNRQMFHFISEKYSTISSFFSQNSSAANCQSRQEHSECLERLECLQEKLHALARQMLRFLEESSNYGSKQADLHLVQGRFSSLSAGDFLIVAAIADYLQPESYRFMMSTEQSELKRKMLLLSC